MKKKRLAIQIFGLMRSYKDTINSLIEKVIIANEKEYDIDIFIHTWNISDTGEVSHHNKYGLDTGHHISDKEIDEIKKLYNPKKIEIEEQKELSEEEIKSALSYGINIDGLGAVKKVKNIYHTMKRVNDIRKEYEKENNIKYDWIIQTRADIEFYNPLVIEFFIINALYRSIEFKWENYENLNNLVLTAHSEQVVHNMKNIGYIPATDCVFMGKLETIDKATNMKDKFLKTIFLGAEGGFCENASLENLIIAPIMYYYGKDWMIKRTKEENQINIKTNNKTLTLYGGG